MDSSLASEYSDINMHARIFVVGSAATRAQHTVTKRSGFQAARHPAATRIQLRRHPAPGHGGLCPAQVHGNLRPPRLKTTGPSLQYRLQNSVDIQEQERRDRDRRRQMMDTPNTFNDMMYDEEAYESLDVGDDESEYGLRQGHGGNFSRGTSRTESTAAEDFPLPRGARALPLGEAAYAHLELSMRAHTRATTTTLLGKSPMMTA